MKILYGVSGDGYGHSSRALTLGEYLESKGHEIIFLTYGSAYKVLKKRFKCFKVNGLKIIFKRSILKKRKTLKYNLDNFPKNLRKIKKFHRLMTQFNPDLCISDMEPIVPILRYWYKKPLISFDNQHRLTNLELEIPSKYHSDYVLARTVIDAFVSKADYFVITSFGKPKIKAKYRKNTFVVSPIIRELVMKIDLKPDLKGQGKILVYLTRQDSRIIQILKGLDEQFIMYGYNKNQKVGNIEFKTSQYFLEDLKDCKAIIATSGFTLISEAIYLKKPYLALPLKGQFEQVLNALFLKKSGFGDYVDELNEKDIPYFLYNLANYKRNLNKNKMGPKQLFRVFDKILKKLSQKEFN